MQLTRGFMRRFDPHARLSEPRGVSFGARSLSERVERLSSWLRLHLPEKCAVGLLADNSPDWAIADLALQGGGFLTIPIPGFFSSEQRRVLIGSHDVRAILAPVEAASLLPEGFRSLPALEGFSIALHSRGGGGARDSIARGTKLTFTSGSTGSPKGILLTADRQWRTAASLAAGLKEMNIRRHLALLPMSVLLENVAGLYTALSLGAEVILPRLAEVGLSGSSTFDACKALSALRETESESAILLPQMLRALTAELRSSGERLRSLKFVAVGGGKVAPSLIDEARRVGLPVYEGYGLSEACSVVALNLPGKDRPGSVGRPLAHQEVAIADDGEIRVRDYSATHLINATAVWTDTGDIGSIDADGFLHVTGRKKNVLITGFGRNVSPEWPESALLAHAEILQAMAYGEGQAQLSALIVPLDPRVERAQMQAVVDRANETLPDYARIGDWQLIAQPFSVKDGTLTSNGRLRRDCIARRHASLIYSNGSLGVIDG